MSVRRRFWPVVLLAACGLAGCSYNPGYFPYLLPGGPIVPHHAKPGGWGYFRNFDPEAHRVEIAPCDTIAAPLGTPVVLVGTVFDRDGQPRRSRRIEWWLEGVGTIVEADESGLYPGRGYKVDGRYAVTYTNYRTHTITRGNDDPADDVVIAPGQTFCVVSSTVPGETVVTAYAPEVFNWNNGRATVRIVWGEGRFQFPPPAVVRYGGEHTLLTSVQGQRNGLPGSYRVRYRVLDGPPVRVIARGSSTAGSSHSGSDSREAEVFTDAEGQAMVRLVQLQPQPGRSRVLVEVIEPTENGTGQVVARRETLVEWAAPDLGLRVAVPRTAGVQVPYAATITVDNAGTVDSPPVQVQVRLSGASLARSEPPPRQVDAEGNYWFELPAVPGRGQQQVQLQLVAAAPGEASLWATARTADGLQASHRGDTRIETGRIHAVADAPAVVRVGEPVPIRLAVTNAGAAPIDNAIAWIDYDEGLTHPTPDRPLELAVGRIEAGQTRTVDVSLTPQRSGRFGVRASVTADGGLRAAAEPVTLEARQAALAVAVNAPPMVYVPQECVVTVTVSNRGEVAARGGQLRLVVPPQLRVKSADSGGRIGPAAVEWPLETLPPGGQKTVSIVAVAQQLVDQTRLTAVAVAEIEGGRAGAAPLQAQAEAAVAVIGTPAVVLELIAPPGPVGVGQGVTYQVRLRNAGTLPAQDVAVAITFSEQVQASRGLGPHGQTARLEGASQVVFPTLSELRPGETVLFRIDATAAQAGTGRVRAAVRAAHLRRPLQEEQAITITPR